MRLCSWGALEDRLVLFGLNLNGRCHVLLFLFEFGRHLLLKRGALVPLALVLALFQRLTAARKQLLPACLKPISLSRLKNITSPQLYQQNSSCNGHILFTNSKNELRMSGMRVFYFSSRKTCGKEGWIRRRHDLEKNNEQNKKDFDTISFKKSFKCSYRNWLI